MKVNEEKVKRDFRTLSQNSKPKPKIIKNCINAFIIGGLICDVGQFISNLLMNFGLPKEMGANYTTIAMIFIGAFLTGIGVYDKIANVAGAGSIVPITGFANSVVAPAIEFKKEGFVFGVAAKMFTIAGPVLVYGIGSSVIVGIVYYFFTK